MRGKTSDALITIRAIIRTIGTHYSVTNIIFCVRTVLVA